LAVVAAGVLTASAFGAVGQTVRAGNLIITVELLGFSPQRLPADRKAPIVLEAKSSIRTVDGTHPPAAKTLALEFDEHAGINTRGLPTCSVGRLLNTLSDQARSICPKALIGTGRAGAEILFPEQPPFFASGQMLVFNGRPKSGHKVLIFHVYARVPAPTTFVTTAVVSKASGIYGVKTLLRIPTIVAGQGSLTFAEVELGKTWTHRGRRQSLLMATCPTGRFFVRGDLHFVDGSQLAGKVARSCTPVR
jgi:hypothetical protein